jgi:hypothetical protein
MKNKIANCTHPVPPNQYGIFAMHCRDNQPILADDLAKIIDGPIAAMEPILEAELAKPVHAESVVKLLTAEDAASRIVKRYGKSLDVLAY